MAEYLDELEIRSPEQRERAQFAALAGRIAQAKAQSRYFAKALASVDPAAMTSRAALVQVPVMRKSDLHALQQNAPPFGGLTAVDTARLAKIFVSPGPIYDPEGTVPDYWRLRRALYAAGFRAGDLVQNCFSYHLVPAGSMLEGGLRALGCVVIPAGVGQTDMQVATMADLRPVGYTGTPSFLKLVLEKGEELKRDLSGLKKALVSGEAFPAPLRELFVARGIAAFQAYATADVGTIAFETSAREGLVVDEGVLVEIVRPGTGDPVPDGEVGEIVVTSIACADYPLIRFATGDLSATLAGVSLCGRTNMRIKGWMGRADQTTKVRGMFVHPHQIADVVKRFPLIQRARVVVDTADDGDRMRVLCAVSNTVDGLKLQIETAVREITRLRGDVEFVEAQVLPNDGKVIEDLRKVS
ncbi:MAG: AMP-dependent synthetase [Candidatus Muproteobacteria bacterium RBG_16_60_9]|uniref:AMP-dependent synthetase n=1 Tax=Candidatus Muproteobacteria bacterium RBG_16_60_9 TaxID=1817755 RepID=A0A1F6VEY3_9PROT|nr:MAG: AMP-dependent synthetase [Candidatus Muproteobacteria bacterium RBG_16_60_9]